MNRVYCAAYGEVVERPKAPRLKRGDEQSSVGSNPTLSANYLYKSITYNQKLILPTNLPINRITLGNFSSIYSQPTPPALPAQQPTPPPTLTSQKGTPAVEEFFRKYEK